MNFGEYFVLLNKIMKLLSGLIGFGLAKSVPVGQSTDQDVESLEGIFDEMEINEKLHLDLFEGDILGVFSNLLLSIGESSLKFIKNLY